MRPDPKRVAARFANTRSKTAAMTRTAGEVRFIKDRSGDANQWGWGTPGPNGRSIQPDFAFNARHLKHLDLQHNDRLRGVAKEAASSQCSGGGAKYLRGGAFAEPAAEPS